MSSITARSTSTAQPAPPASTRSTLALVLSTYPITAASIRQPPASTQVATAMTGGVVAKTTGTGTVNIRLAGANAGNATVLADTGGTVAVSEANINIGVGGLAVDGNVAINLGNSSVSRAAITVIASTTG